jgi:hypothetical protein
MGRGRAKAKQQKVARDLKYNSQPTDLDALQRELGHTPHGTTFVVPEETEDDEDDGDDWASAAR